MTPRIAVLRCIWPQSSSQQSSILFRAFSSSPSLAVTRAFKRLRRRYRDPYALAQAEARRVANKARQVQIEEKRLSSLGDPVRGITTDYVRSFDTGVDPGAQTKPLNFHFTPDTVRNAVERSSDVLAPLEARRGIFADAYGPPPTEGEHAASPAAAEAARDDHRARMAIGRIVQLGNGSSKDRLRHNKQRCVDFFGRHRTDLFRWESEAPATDDASSGRPVLPTGRDVRLSDEDRRAAGETPRRGAFRGKGPDTGSPEVQAAILTAKIRTLADFLASRGGQDKANKRNLRLLVHRRQKLLAYLRRRDRGGERWQRCVQTLGLTEGTWKGEITM